MNCVIELLFASKFIIPLLLLSTLIWFALEISTNINTYNLILSPPRSVHKHHYDPNRRAKQTHQESVDESSTTEMSEAEWNNGNGDENFVEGESIDVKVREPASHVPQRLQENLHLLDHMYPKIKLDLLLIQSDDFSPALVQKLSNDLNIPASFMFIRCPGASFLYNIGEFKGVRTIMQ